MSEIKLTQYSHGGGCGCKIAPGLLAEILGQFTTRASFPNLMVGTETSDDAAVWRLNETQAIVATTDFFMPIVDDPYDFGRIAATNPSPISLPWARSRYSHWRLSACRWINCRLK